MLAKALTLFQFHNLRLPPFFRRAAHIKLAGLFVILVLQIAAIATAIGYGAAFLLPRAVQFSYAQNNCFSNPIVLPELVHTSPGVGFKLDLQPGPQLAGHTLFSTTTCIDLVKPEATTETLTLTAFGTNLLQKRITITSPAPPAVSSLVPLDKPIAAKAALKFRLAEADTTFNYKVSGNQKGADCQKNTAELACDLKPLELAQSANYDIAVHRIFNDKPTDTVFSQKLATIEATHVVSTSIAPNQKVYTIPPDITLVLNKPVASLGGVVLRQVTNEGKDIAVTPRIDGTHVVLHFDQPLPRSAQFELTATHIDATDGGYLIEPFRMHFSTSGGPKVTGISLGTYRTQPETGFTITFDSPIAAGQALQNFIHVESGGQVLSATVTSRGNSVNVAPSSPLGSCVPFVVKILDGLKSDAGVSGGSAWQFNSRTTCQVPFSIGLSAQGRAITAYRFGTGPSKIIFCRYYSWQ